MQKYNPAPIYSDCVSESILRKQIPIIFRDEEETFGRHRVLSLFSGCGGMDLGFEGSFIANKKSFHENDERIEKVLKMVRIFSQKT